MQTSALPCNPDCTTTPAVDLNRDCRCKVVDVGRIHAAIAARIPGALDADIHAHLFSPYALFVEQATIDVMAGVARGVFEVARHASYVDQVLRHAPRIARHDPGSIGGVLGLDFHLTVAGPQLIEINTNPGGLLLNAMAIDAVQSCEPAVCSPSVSAGDAIEAAAGAWLDDALRQRGLLPKRIAIVDLVPREQYLYPEFALYAEAFRRRGVDCVIRPPGDLAYTSGVLHDRDGPIDMVYNRLTDFALADPENQALASAYREHAVAVTPHPRAHAVFADKRNLAILGAADRLRAIGVAAATAARLAEAIPPTVVLDAHNRDALWADRDRWFFKPATGYGSRGSYRGDKLTRRVWQTLHAAPYVAQRIAPPGARIVHEGLSLKADVRCYASESRMHLFAARLYQGQTTNMRTPGGGFAAVLTVPAIGDPPGEGRITYAPRHTPA